MTLKWLAIDPTYCEHSSLHVQADGSVRGWFVLEDSKRAGRGECGELLMHLKWSYEPEQDPARDERLARQGGDTRLATGGLATGLTTGLATAPTPLPSPRTPPPRLGLGLGLGFGFGFGLGPANPNPNPTRGRPSPRSSSSRRTR